MAIISLTQQVRRDRRPGPGAVETRRPGNPRTWCDCPTPSGNRKGGGSLPRRAEGGGHWRCWNDQSVNTSARVQRARLHNLTMSPATRVGYLSLDDATSWSSPQAGAECAGGPERTGLPNQEVHQCLSPSPRACVTPSIRWATSRAPSTRPTSALPPARRSIRRSTTPAPTSRTRTSRRKRATSTPARRHGQRPAHRQQGGRRLRQHPQDGRVRAVAGPCRRQPRHHRHGPRHLRHPGRPAAPVGAAARLRLRLQRQHADADGRHGPVAVNIQTNLSTSPPRRRRSPSPPPTCASATSVATPVLRWLQGTHGLAAASVAGQPETVTYTKR